MGKTTTAIKPGTKFLDTDFGVHTVREVTDDHIIHEYTCKNKKVTDGFMYRHVFDKFVKAGIIYILPSSDN